jgi:hypothetical protein
MPIGKWVNWDATFFDIWDDIETVIENNKIADQIFRANSTIMSIAAEKRKNNSNSGVNGLLKKYGMNVRDAKEMSAVEIMLLCEIEYKDAKDLKTLASNIEKKKFVPYTADEDNIILNGGDISSIAKRLNRSYQSIAQRRHLLKKNVA